MKKYLQFAKCFFKNFGHYYTSQKLGNARITLCTCEHCGYHFLITHK